LLIHSEYPERKLLVPAEGDANRRFTNGAFAGSSPVLNVNSKAYYGKTYGEWVVAYWQWAMSFPTAASPWLSDSDGSLAGLGQSGLMRIGPMR